MQDKDLFGILSHGVRFFASLFGSLSCNPHKNKTSRSAFLANREVIFCINSAGVMLSRFLGGYKLNTTPTHIGCFHSILLEFLCQFIGYPWVIRGNAIFAYIIKTMRSLWGDGIVSLSTYIYDFFVCKLV